MASPPEINVGVLVAHSPATDAKRLRSFAERTVADALPELEAASGARWVFHAVEPTGLSNDDTRRPSDFLDEASLRMVEGPYDAVVVVTDVGLVSRRHAVVAGLASHVSRVAILSARKLLIAPRGEPARALEDEAVRWNAAALLLHLVGHLVGLRHAREAGDAMAPYAFDASRRGVPSFHTDSRARLARLSAEAPERERVGGGPLATLAFHVASAARNPGEVAWPLLRNRAPLLPLSLPSLATAAVVPTFILVFTAEIWDVGLSLDDRVAWGFALASLLGATWYLTGVLNLFYPRKEKRILTEHMAIVNVTIFLTILSAILGLFVMVGLLMLAMETVVFPPGLISTWPTLPDPEVTMWDKVRLAIFIATISVVTGALAGGLESRTVVRHLALFRDEP